MRISTPSYGRPIQPILSCLKGTLPVPYALFSVIPQPSEMLIPILANHSITAGAKGAEPLAHKRALLMPKPLRIFFATTLFRNGILSNTSNFFCGIFASTPIWNLVHKRGTEINNVGWQWATSLWNVARSSTKCILPPL